MITKMSPVGVFDSGVGGISVLKELVRLLPGEDFIFLGDEKNAPYGTKTAEEVRRYSFDNVDLLRKRDVKAIVIACNTATGAAVKELRGRFPDFPIIGTEPAIKPAVEKHPGGHVIVMATPVTIKNKKFKDLLEKFDGQACITPLPCPGLMEFVERGIFDGPELDDYLNDLFKGLDVGESDAIVLGCTHYPFVKNAVRSAAGPRPEILDGGEGVARELKRKLKEKDMLNSSGNNGRVTFLTTALDCIQDKKRFMEELLKKH
ncbi:MAG: glutamate racemase [Lachnospiraceae bacterium]|jgi:glutamate racemase|nr:glutamate racemase [Lachnospiraceae bacterium]MEE3461367.1 glutamate racemase [Lachnospiraceae bacterium]